MRARRAAALALLALAACAGPSGPPHRDPRADALADVAEQEWRLWGRPEVARDAHGQPCRLDEGGHCRPVDVGCGDELSSRSCGMVNRYWWGVSDYRNPCDRTDECRFRRPVGRVPVRTRPWSAAFVSFVFATAGFREDEFEFSVTHADYVAAARDGRLPGLVLLPLPRRPLRGDVLCAGRGRASGLRVADIDRITPAWAPGPTTPMHCDIVVRVGPHSIDVIGGNVLQSVSRRRIALDADGRVQAGDGAGRHALLLLRTRDRR